MPTEALDPVTAIEKSLLASADTSLRSGGWAPQPQVHMLLDDWDQPYVGVVRTRPYTQGGDAVRAITRLGVAPASIMATRIVVAWESADLLASLHGYSDYKNALVFVIASLTGQHTVHVYPLTLHIGLTPAGPPRIRPEWGSPTATRNGILPDPIRELLATWRARAGEPKAMLPGLLDEGYEVRVLDR